SLRSPDATNATDKRCYVTLRGTLRTQGYITHRSRGNHATKSRPKLGQIDGRLPTHFCPATAKTQMKSEVVIVHSSDLHVDHDYTARIHGGDGTSGLACVLATARGIRADVVLLAGDTFESHRLPQDLLDRTAAVIAGAAMPVVLLPGNHDPAIPDAVF